MELKRILHIGLTGNLGGIEVFAMNIYRNIDCSKIQFDFLDDCHGIYFKDEIEKMGGKIIPIPTRRENYFEYRKILKQLLSSGEYVAVHIHCLSVANIDAAKIALKYKKTKVIIHSHQDMKLRHLKSEILHRYNRKWLENKNIIRLACSEQAAKWNHGKKEFLKGNVEIIPNAIDLSRYVYDPKTQKAMRSELEIDDDVIVIGCVGRFAYQKNHDFMVDIFKAIHIRKNNTILLLVGGDGGLLAATEEKVEQLELSDCVKFLGMRNDVDRLVQCFDIFILPSRWEGLGIVYIEAQTAGALTVGSSVVPVEAAASNLMHYIDVEATAEQWAEKILNLYEEYSKRDRISPIEEIRQNGYNIESMAKKMSGIYLSITRKED